MTADQNQRLVTLRGEVRSMSRIKGTIKRHRNFVNILEELNIGSSYSAREETYVVLRKALVEFLGRDLVG